MKHTKGTSASLKKTVQYAFRHSLPIMIGFLPIGLAYGILMQNIGYNVLWTGACSTFVLAGSLQFLMVSFFSGGFSVLSVVLLSLFLNSRHMFYGLSLIEPFNRFHKRSKWFLIFSLTDECYSLHCSRKIEKGMNEELAFVLTAAFVMFYWVAFSVLGNLVGNFIPFDTTGIDFSLTALFTVILIDQMRSAKNILPVPLAMLSSVVSLLLFGPDRFLLPALLVTVAALLLMRPYLDAASAGKERKQ